MSFYFSQFLFNRASKNKKIKYGGGFTLVETLIAITILISAVVGPMVVVQKSLSSANFSKSQIISFHLAGEAIEYIRNKRDENTLSGVSWTNGLSECVGKKCAVDVVNDTISQCSENCPNLQFDSANGFYGYDSNWGNSIFNRVVEIKSISEEELSVLVTIFWKTEFLQKNFLLGKIYLIGNNETRKQETKNKKAKRFHFVDGDGHFFIVVVYRISIYNITLKELILSSYGRNSQFAFYAADTGLECALYWNIKRCIFNYDTVNHRV